MRKIIPDINIYDLKRRLYQRYKDFNKFYDINENRQAELRNDISYLTNDYSRLELYSRVLQLVVLDYKKNYTFDEKLFCLIEACDPDLLALKIFNRFGSPKKDDPLYSEYLKTVNEALGFSDDNLRKFEGFYLRTIVYKKYPEETKDVKKLTKTNTSRTNK